MTSILPDANMTGSPQGAEAPEGAAARRTQRRAVGHGPKGKRSYAGRARRMTWGSWLLMIPLAILAIGWLLPFLWALATAFKTEPDAASGDATWIGQHGPTIKAFTSILSQGNVYLWAWNSLWTSALVTIITVAISALASVAIFVFIGAWNNFLWPFLVINDTNLMTMPVGLQTVISAYGVQYSQVMAQAVLAAIPLIIVFMIFQRQIVKGVATTGFGGQ